LGDQEAISCFPGENRAKKNLEKLRGDSQEEASERLRNARRGDTMASTRSCKVKRRCFTKHWLAQIHVDQRRAGKARYKKLRER
jgi:hypothetical protein